MEINVNLGKNAERVEHVELKRRDDGLVELSLTGAIFVEGSGYTGGQTLVSRVVMTSAHARVLASIFESLGRA